MKTDLNKLKEAAAFLEGVLAVKRQSEAINGTHIINLQKALDEIQLYREREFTVAATNIENRGDVTFKEVQSSFTSDTEN